MDTDWLEKLLTEADRKSPPGVNASELASKILRTRKHRRIARYSVLGTTAAAALISGLVVMPRPQQAPLIAAVPAKKSVESLADLQHRADELERTISILLKDEVVSARRDRFAATPPALIELPMERSAATVLGEADRLSTGGSATDAIRVYKQIVEHFPDTGAAATARNNLRSINVKG